LVETARFWADRKGEPGLADAHDDRIHAVIARWRNSGGAERANYVMYLTELCALLGLP